ncbi:MAG: hypothetical protein J6V20_03260 [Bacteroidaceae bacterium]|nr:hypothetical protein [Bacteroidaceae bacterium]
MKKITKLLSLIMLVTFASCDFPGIFDDFGNDGGDDVTNNETGGGPENETQQPEATSWVKYIDKLTIKDVGYRDITTTYEYTHDYDELNRINRITEKISENDDAEINICTLDYSINNEIVISTTEDDAIARGIIGENGLVKTIYETEENITTDIMSYIQNEDGYLTELKELHIREDEVNEYTTVIEYENGMISKFDGDEIPESYYNNQYKNDKINIDINWLNIIGFGMDFPCILSYTRNIGNIGEYIIETGSRGYESNEVFEEVFGALTEDPNYKEYQSITYYDCIDEIPESTMLFDEEGCPTKFEFVFRYQQYKEEWYRVAGEKVESKDPNDPESKNMYMIVSTEKTTSPTDVIKDRIITYTFEYRQDM